jgi:hypothetical protein
VFEHPTRVPNASRVSSVKYDLSVFIFLLLTMTWNSIQKVAGFGKR